MCSLRQLNSRLKSAMDSAPWQSRSNLFFAFKTIQGFFKWGHHSKNGKYIRYVRALIMPLLVSYSTYGPLDKTSHIPKPDSLGVGGGGHKNIGLGERGALQAVSTAAYYGSSIPGLLLMAKTIPVLGSCYSLTKSLSYFCSIPYRLEPEVFL